MDKNSLLLSKLLGEVYRTQKRLNIDTGVTDGHIYGLLNGFETSIDEEVQAIGFISKDKIDVVAEVLDEYMLDDSKLANFKGFYDIEHTLSSRGVDRGDALIILKHFKADEKFERVINKMNSSGSPVECTTFELYDWEK